MAFNDNFYRANLPSFGPKLSQGQTWEQFRSTYKPSAKYKPIYESLGQLPDPRNTRDWRGGNLNTGDYQSYQRAWNQIYDEEQAYLKKEANKTKARLGMAVGDSEEAKKDKLYQARVKAFADGKAADPGSYDFFKKNPYYQDVVEDIHERARLESPQTKRDILANMYAITYTNGDEKGNNLALSKLEELKKENPELEGVDDLQISYEAIEAAQQGDDTLLRQDILTGVAKKTLTPEEFNKYITLPSLELKRQYVAAVTQNRLMGRKTDKDKRVQERTDLANSVENAVYNAAHLNLHELKDNSNWSLGTFLENLFTTFGNAGAQVYNGAVDLVGWAASKVAQGGSYLANERVLPENAAINDYLDKIITSESSQFSTQLGNLIKEEEFTINKNDDANTREAKKYRQGQAINFIRKFLDENSPSYHKYKEYKGSMFTKDLDLLQYYTEFSADIELLGEQTAVQNLLNKAQRDIANNIDESSEAGSIYAKNAWRGFKADVVATTYAGWGVLKNSLNELWYGATFQTQDDLLHDQALQAASDIQSSGYIPSNFITDLFGISDQEGYEQWKKDMKENPQIAMSSFQNVYDPDKMNEVWQGNVWGTLGDLAGQYGFTAGTTLVSCGGSALTKGLLRQVSKGYLATTRRQLFLNDVLENAARADAMSATTSLAEKTLAKRTLQRLSQAKEIIVNPKAAIQKMRDRSIFRKGLNKEISQLDFSTKKRITKDAMDRALKWSAQTQNKGQIFVAGAVGTAEGALEAKSTYDEVLTSTKGAADQAWEYAHTRDIDNIKQLVMQDEQAIQDEMAATKESSKEDYALVGEDLSYITNPQLLQIQLQEQAQQEHDLRQQAIYNLVQFQIQDLKSKDALYQKSLNEAEVAAMAASTTNFWFNSMINGMLSCTLKSNTMSKDIREALAQRSDVLSKDVLRKSISWVTDKNSRLGFKAEFKKASKTFWESNAKEKWKIFKESAIGKAMGSSFGEFLEEWGQDLSNEASSKIAESIYGSYLQHIYNPETRDALNDSFASLVSNSVGSMALLDQAIMNATHGVLETAFSQQAIKDGIFGALSSSIGGFNINNQFVSNVVNIARHPIKSIRGLARGTKDVVSAIASPRETAKNIKNKGFKGTVKSIYNTLGNISPVRWGSSIFDSFIQGGEQSAAVKSAVASINQILSDGDNQQLWDWLNGAASLDAIYQEALQEGDELSSRDYKHMKAVQNALILNLIAETGSQKTEGSSEENNKGLLFLQKIQEAADLAQSEEQLQFDENGNLVIPNKPIAPNNQQIQQNPELQEQYERATDTYNLHLSVANIIKTFNKFDNGVDSQLTDEEKIARISSNAAKQLELVDKVRVASHKYDGMFGENLTADVKAALIHADLLFENQNDRFASLQNLYAGLQKHVQEQTSTESTSTSLLSQDRQLAGMVANYGTESAIKKQLAQTREDLEKTQLLLKNTNDSKKKAALKEKISELRSAERHLQYAQAYIQEYFEELQTPTSSRNTATIGQASSPESANVVTETSQAIVGQKEYTTQESREAKLVLTAQDILNLSPTERLRMLDEKNRSNYSKEQQEIIDKLIATANDYYNSQAKNVTSQSASPFVQAMQDTERLQASISTLLAQRKDAVIYPERLNVFGQMLANSEQARILKNSFKDLLDSNKYSSYEDQKKAIQAKINELEPKSIGSSREAFLNRRAIQYLVREGNSIKGITEYNNNTRSMAFFVFQSAQGHPTITKDVDNFNRLKATLWALMSEKKYDDVRRDILNVLKNGGQLKASQRDIIEQILRNKEYIKYLDLISLSSQEAQKVNALKDQDSQETFTVSDEDIAKIIEYIQTLYGTRARKESQNRRQTEAKKVADTQKSPIVQPKTPTPAAAAVKPASSVQVAASEGNIMTLINPRNLISKESQLLQYLEQKFGWSNYLYEFDHQKLQQQIDNDKKRALGGLRTAGPRCVFIDLNIDGKKVRVAAVRTESNDLTITVKDANYKVLGVVSVEGAYDEQLGDQAQIVKNNSGAPITFSIKHVSKNTYGEMFSDRSNPRSENIPLITGADRTDKTAVGRIMGQFMRFVRKDISMLAGQQIVYQGQVISYENRNLKQARWVDQQANNEDITALEWIKRKSQDEQKAEKVTNISDGEYHPVLSKFVSIISQDFDSFKKLMGNLRDQYAQEPAEILPRLFATVNKTDSTKRYPLLVFRGQDATDTTDIKVYENTVTFNIERKDGTIKAITISRDSSAADLYNLLEEVSSEGKHSDGAFLQVDDNLFEESMRNKFEDSSNPETWFVTGLATLGIINIKNPEHIHAAVEIKITNPFKPKTTSTSSPDGTRITAPIPHGTIDVSSEEIIAGRPTSRDELIDQQISNNIREARAKVNAIRNQADKPVLENQNAEVYKNSTTIFQRVTSVLRHLVGYHEDEYQEGPYHNRAVDLGNTIDNITRAFFSIVEDMQDFKRGKSPIIHYATEEDLNKIKENVLKQLGLEEAPNIGEMGFDTLIKNLIALQNDFSRKGWFVVPSGITAFGSLSTDTQGKVNTAGTIDLLVYDERGQFRIIDIKTMHYEHGQGVIGTRLTKEKLQDHSQRWAAQTSIYKELLMQQYNLDFADDSLYILPMGVYYSPEVAHPDGSKEVTITDENTGQMYIQTLDAQGNPKQIYTGEEVDDRGKPIKTDRRKFQTGLNFISRSSSEFLYSVDELNDVTLDSKETSDIETTTPFQGIPIESNPTLESDPIEKSQLDTDTYEQEYEQEEEEEVEEEPSIPEPTVNNNRTADDVLNAEATDDDLLDLNPVQHGIERVITTFRRVKAYRVTGIRKARISKTRKRISKNQFIINSMETILTRLLGINSSSSIVADLNINSSKLAGSSSRIAAILHKKLVPYYSSKISSYDSYIQNSKHLLNRNTLLYKFFTNAISEEELTNQLQQLNLSTDDVPILYDYFNGDAEQKQKLKQDFLNENSSEKQIKDNYTKEIEVFQALRQDCVDKMNFVNSAGARSILEQLVLDSKNLILNAVESSGEKQFFDNMGIAESIVDTNIESKATDYLKSKDINVAEEQSTSQLLYKMAEETKGTQKLILTKLAVMLESTELKVSFENINKPGRLGSTEVIVNEDGSEATHIVLNLANIKNIQQLQRALVHESVHAMTHFLISNDEELQRDIEDIIDYINNYFYKIENVNTSTIYGLSSPAEFIAEFFSNTMFQETLKNIPAIQSKNIFQRAVSYIAKKLFANEKRNVYSQIEKQMYEILSISHALANSGTKIQNKESLKNQITNIKERRAKLFGYFAEQSLEVQELIKKKGLTEEEFNNLSTKVQDYVVHCCIG